MSRSALILGANSDIGKSLALRLASAGYNLQLAARDIKRLDKHKNLLIRKFNIDVLVYELNILNPSSFESFLLKLPYLPNIVICVVGLMHVIEKDDDDTKIISTIIRSNFEGPSQILSMFAHSFKARGFSCIVGISSVAGERGRSSNYIYGSSKSGFTEFLSGLRNRFSKSNINVITILPGYVETKMTLGMKLPKFLTASPMEVADTIKNAIERKRTVVYVRPIWRIIMIIIKIIPEKIFMRTKF